jgi:hypothetical protein
MKLKNGNNSAKWRTLFLKEVIASITRQCQAFFSPVIRILVLLLGFSFTPAHAYPEHRIALPNGEYIESADDLKVKAIGGHITAKRVWTNSRWYLNPEWADLKFSCQKCNWGAVSCFMRSGFTQCCQ